MSAHRAALAPPRPVLGPAQSITVEPAIDPAGRQVIVLALHGPRGGLAFQFSLDQACGTAAHLANLASHALAAPPAIASLATPAGPHLIREA